METIVTPFLHMLERYNGMVMSPAQPAAPEEPAPGMALLEPSEAIPALGPLANG
jgi:hypothetical protein